MDRYKGTYEYKLTQKEPVQTMTIIPIPAKSTSIRSTDYINKKGEGAGATTIEGSSNVIYPNSKTGANNLNNNNSAVNISGVKVLSSSFNPETTKTLINKQGISLSPGETKNITAINSISAPTEKAEYKRPLFESITGALKKAANVGTIGQEGLAAYQKNIYSQFDYTFEPKTSKKLDYNIYPRSYYDPSLTNTKGLTYGEVENKKTSDIYLTAGILRKEGDVLEVLPNRIKETTINKMAPEFEDKLSSAIKEGGDIYQSRIDRGELTLEQAKERYDIFAELKTKDLNEQFNLSANKNINDRFNKVSAEYFSNLQFKKNINIPTGETYFKRGVKTAEIAGLTAATMFGGSGLTLAAGGIIGLQTEKQALEYTTQFSGLSTSERLIGAASISLGAYTSFSILNLGRNRFFNEWRNIRYQELINRPAVLSGRETLVKKKLVSFETTANKKTLYGYSKNQAITDVYKTGKRKLGIFSKSTTTTIIKDPQTFDRKNIVTIDKNKFSGRAFTYPKEEGEVIALGEGNIISKRTNKIFRTKFAGVSNDAGSYYIVEGGNPFKIKFDDKGIIIKSSYGYSGVIQKLKTSDTSRANFINLYGAKKTSLINIQQGATATATGNIIQQQNLNLKTLSMQTIKPTADNIIIPPVNALTRTRAGIDERTAIRNMYISVTAQQQQLKERTEIKPGVLPINAVKAATGNKNILGNPPALAQAQQQSLKTELKTNLRRPTPNTITPSINQDYFNIYDAPPVTPILFKYDRLAGLNLSSNIVKGGEKRTGYTPSFSAILYKIYGRANKGLETGINFRPITKGFRFFKMRSFK
jgi:hypothetical protein